MSRAMNSNRALIDKRNKAIESWPKFVEKQVSFKSLIPKLSIETEFLMGLKSSVIEIVISGQKVK